MYYYVKRKTHLNKERRTNGRLEDPKQKMKCKYVVGSLYFVVHIPSLTSE